MGTFNMTTPWAILREAWPQVEASMRLGLTDSDFQREEAPDPICELRTMAPLCAVEARVPRLPTVKGAVAVMPIRGVIVQHREDTWYGGVTTDWIGRTIDELQSNPNVGAIVLDVDSPGGIVYGVEETADKIRNYRGSSKPIYSIANGMAASAAYWIASAADKFFVIPSGQVGSIGVWQPHVDVSGWEEKMGVKTTLISAGKYKVEGHPYAPLDDEARASMQGEVDAYYARFLSGVAANRGVKVADVKNGFGEGRVVMSDVAKAEGMVDGVGTLDELLAAIIRPEKGAAPKAGNRNMTSARIRIAEAEGAL
jgi:signal peptide peptidase SppA